MAVGGRKPTPAEVKATTGNPGKRPVQSSVGFAPGDTLAPPKRWRKKGPEREEWERLVPDLQRTGVAKAIHQGLLEGICELYGTMQVARKAKDWTAHRMAFDAYRKGLNEIGGTPATEGRVGGTGANGHSDPSDEFFGPKLA